jgi:hypothetical protein
MEDIVKTNTPTTHQDELSATHDPQQKLFKAHGLRAWNHCTITITKPTTTCSMQIMLKQNN